MTRLAEAVADVRRRGLAYSSPGMLPGIDAIAAPVFSVEGLECVITVIGQEGKFDVSERGVPARKLLEVTQSLSRDAGYGGNSAESAETQPPA